jgi:hypothetical protein
LLPSSWPQASKALKTGKKIAQNAWKNNQKTDAVQTYMPRQNIELHNHIQLRRLQRFLLRQLNRPPNYTKTN